MPARALIVILAAGEGKRMRSILPKVLHRVGGKPLVEHLVQAALKSGLGPVIVVVGHRRDMVIEALVDYPIDIVVQADQRGTGHAMQMVREHQGNYDGACLVVPGDAPFLSPETLRSLVQLHEEGDYAATLLTAELADPTGYGRVVRSAAGDVERIVEEGDATSEEKQIREINSSVYVFDYRELSRVLDELKTNNSQRELYLTDSIAALKAAGRRVGLKQASDPVEIMGINDPLRLREADRIFRERQPPAPPERPRPLVGLEDEEEEEEGEGVRERSVLDVDEEVEGGAETAIEGGEGYGSPSGETDSPAVESDAGTSEMDADYPEPAPAPSGVETDGGKP